VGSYYHFIEVNPCLIFDRRKAYGMRLNIQEQLLDYEHMTHPVQNINHSAFRSMFEREKLSGNNFNDWFRQLKLVLRFEKKMFVIEQPLPAAPAADSAANVLVEWNAIYDAYNEWKRFDLIQTFHACKQEEGKPVAAYVIQMKGYVDQLERLGKMTRKSFPHRPERVTDLLGIICTDVFKNEVENQLGKTIKALRSDRGGEYISQEFKDYFKTCGIIQHLTPPYTPQHNGVSERRNHTLLDMVRSMMNLTILLLSFWDYALESVTRILNMVPTKKVDKTPYELWYGKVPNLSYLKVWGCDALVKQDKPGKLQQRYVKCIFIGYPKETMGYYFYFPHENKIVVVRYAEFFEKNLITQEVSGRDMDLEEIQYKDTSPSEITSEIPMEVEGF
ncbi:retrotransposon protein, putative, ty1-copia subclass, partial [Tanacetum coccineum]